ncbi:hypothetical protein U1Q18_026070 [Sarracenia purpurea var. burkii]
MAARSRRGGRLPRCEWVLLTGGCDGAIRFWDWCFKSNPNQGFYSVKHQEQSNGLKFPGNNPVHCLKKCLGGLQKEDQLLEVYAATAAKSSGGSEERGLLY